MCRCLCIIILWVGVKCLSFDVCIYSSCPFFFFSSFFHVDVDKVQCHLVGVGGVWHHIRLLLSHWR